MPHANIECQFCLTVNRVDLEKATRGPKCHECGKPFLVDRPVKVSEENFDRVISKSEVPIVVDFYADWCGPCRMIAPILDEIASREVGRLLVVKVDTDRAPTLSQRFNIRGIPYLARFENGKKVSDVVGADPGKVRELAAVA